MPTNKITCWCYLRWQIWSNIDLNIKLTYKKNRIELKTENSREIKTTVDLC